MHTSNANGSSAMDVQLEPQSQLLSRIQYVIDSESQFSFLSGESGVGKSFLTTMLVADLTNILVIELNCRKKSTPESLKQDLICQLATDDLSDINQSMTQAIEDAISYYGQSVLVVIDNAHYMPQTFVSALWHSFNEILAAQPTPQYKLNILLVGAKKWAKPVAERLREIDADLVTDFELSYLSTQQAIDFVTSIHPDWSDQKIENYIAKLNSKSLTPQRLIFTEQPIAEGSNLKRFIPAFIISFLLIVIAVGWFYLSNGATSETEQAIQLPPKIIVLSPESIASPDKQQQPILTEVMPEKENSAEQSMDRQPSLSVTSPITDEETVALAAPGGENAADVTKATDASSPADTVVEETSAGQVSELTEGDAMVYLFDEKMLLEMDESHVSLMLGGYSHQSVLERTMAKISDKTDLYVYKTTRNDSDWFVLLYGDFTDRAAAQQALTGASSNLALFSPWKKSFRLIHAEITAVAATMDNNN